MRDNEMMCVRMSPPQTPEMFAQVDGGESAILVTVPSTPLESGKLDR
jgi:hypothetical protein